MSFGRRTTAPAGVQTTNAQEPKARTRRGGYWLGLLTCTLVSAATLAVMPFISQFKLNGAPYSAMLVIGAIAVLNVTVVSAVLMLLTDFALRGLGWRRPWIYALSCALVVFLFYLALALLGGTSSPIFTLYVGVWPSAVGGWVMGLYRR